MSCGNGDGDDNAKAVEVSVLKTRVSYYFDRVEVQTNILNETLPLKIHLVTVFLSNVKTITR